MESTHSHCRYLEQLREGQDFALQGNEPIANETLARLGYELIEATGLFSSTSCKDRRNRPVAMQTFAELQTYFNTEVTDYEQNTPTSASQGYANTAENIQNMIHNELQQIFTQHNPDIFNMNQENEPPAAPVPESAPVPTHEAANSTEVLSELKNLVNALTSQSQNKNNSRSNNRFQGRRNGKRNGGNKQQLPAQGLNDQGGMPVSYCWSHRVATNLRHNSKTCNFKKEGHKDAATFTNKIGG